MARIEVDIEEYIDEISTTFLINELQYRRLDKDCIDQLRSLLSNSDIIDKFNSLKPLSLSDSIKLEEFLDTLNK